MLIASYLPEQVITNEQLATLGWSADKIVAKTGIQQRHIAADNEFAVDLAEQACRRLFAQYPELVAQLDYLLYCTQSPDSLLPNNVSELQLRLNLPTTMGSLDINQGCSGFVYGLSLAKGLLLSQQASRVLLVTAETYSKHIAPSDRANRTIFGDAACATLLTRADAEHLHDFVFGTDGRGQPHLTVKKSGLRYQHDAKASDRLVMNGPALYSFALAVVPQAIDSLLSKLDLDLADIEHVVLHQANGYMLETLRHKLAIKPERFHVSLAQVGNTVSSSIPLVLEQLLAKGQLQPGDRVLLVGFGIGYSWAATLYTHYQ